VNLHYPYYIAAIIALYLFIALIVGIIKKPKGFVIFFKAFWHGMKRVGEGMTSVINFILLLPDYFIGVGITAIAAKISKKHFLDLKLEKKKKSYWKTYNLGTQKEDEHFKMY
jgi:hypothetical protein